MKKFQVTNGECEYRECRICKEPMCGKTDVTLGCKCVIHINCLVHYIRMRIGDKRSLLKAINGCVTKGIMCPYAHKFKDFNECDYTVPEFSKYYLITTSELHALQLVESCESLVKKAADSSLYLKVEEVEKLQRWFDEGEEAQADSQIGKADLPSDEKATMAFIKSTTKPCPNCGFCGTHYHGHSCHHISPYGGCLNCSVDYCFQCLSTGTENLRLRGAPNNCSCPASSWSTFCSPLNNANAVRDFLVITENTPYPHDKRCGCVICPDCRPGRPCSSCPGHCAVCMGFINPGPKDLTESYNIAYNETLQDINSAFRVLLAACMYGDYASFKRQLTALTTRQDITLLDVMSQKDHSQRTLLHYACHENSSSHKLIAELILESCPTLDTNTRDIYGCTPLEYAMDYGNPAVAGLLMVKHRNFDTILLTACRTPKNLPFLLNIIQEVSKNCSPQYIADIKDRRGRTPLHIICNQNIIDRFRMIVLDTEYAQEFMSPYIEVHDCDGNTPLHLACCVESDDISRVINILCSQMRADLTAVNHLNQTPLHYACKRYEEERIQTIKNRILYILQTYSNNLSLYMADGDGNTLFHFEVILEYVMDTLHLIEESPFNGLDFDQCMSFTNVKGHTPLFNAVISGNTKLVANILPLYNCGMSARDKSGNTLLHFACSSNINMLQLIIKNCEPEDLDVVNDKGQTPTHIVCADTSELEAKLHLILNHTHHSLVVKDIEGNTPLHLLAFQDNSDSFRMGYSFYAEKELNGQNSQGETVLHILGRNKRLHFLNQSGINIQAFLPSLSLQDNNGFTPIHYVTADGFCSQLHSVLLEVDPSVLNFQNNFGQTALMRAIIESNSVAITALWNYQTSDGLCLQDIEGNTALYYACDKNIESIVSSILIKNHETVHICNKKGEFPIHAAARANSGALVTLIHYYTERNMNPLCLDGLQQTFFHFIGSLSGNLVKSVSKHFDFIIALKIQNTCGDTPIHCATASSRSDNIEDIVRLLTADNCGGDVLRIVNNQQKSAFHILCESLVQLGQKEQRNRNISFLQHLLEAGASFPGTVATLMVTVDANGLSPVHYLALNRSWDVIEMVFDKCSDIEVNAQDSTGNTIFNIAFTQRNANIIAMMFERFPTTDFCKNLDFEMLILKFSFTAGDFGDIHLRLLRALLNHAVFSADTVIFDNRRLTLMEYVCMRSDSHNLINCILESKRREQIDLLAVNFNGTSLLKFAFSSIKQMPLAQIFLKYEHQIPSSELMILRRTLFEDCNDDDFHVVSNFIEASNCEVMDLLLASQDDSGASLLHVLCRRSSKAALRLAILQKLLAKSRKTVDFQDCCGCTAIHEAMKAREAETDVHLQLLHEDVVALLVQSGANLTILNHDGDSPVHIAARINSPKLMDICIRSDFNFSIVDKRGKSVLHVACENYWTSVVQCLIDALKKDALIIADGEGNTALHILCKQGKDSLAKLLMAKLEPSDLVLENKKGQTPLAMGSNRKEIRRLFSAKKK